MNPRIKSKPCVKCGFPVNRNGRGTSEHYHEAKVVGGLRKVRCDGSDIPYSAHGVPLEATITEVKPSPFHKVLARLHGHSVTWVDFRGARLARANGPIDPMRFVIQEVRDA